VDAPLARVSELLAKGFHRVPVVSAQGKVVNVISQSSIVKVRVATLGLFASGA